MLELLSHREDWYIDSNAEFGDGYSDILLEYEEKGVGIVIEIKYTEDGMETILMYGVACNRKKCRVKSSS